MPIELRPLVERFWKRVEITTSCWLWTGAVNESGYGTIASAGKNSRLIRAHRLSYEMLVGPIPEGLTIDHLCRVRLCVNPDHLEPVTRGENVLRGEGSSARYARRTHCPKGHEYNAVNTRYRLGGSRDCRVCDRLSKRRRPIATEGD